MQCLAHQRPALKMREASNISLLCLRTAGGLISPRPPAENLLTCIPSPHQTPHPLPDPASIQWRYCSSLQFCGATLRFCLSPAYVPLCHLPRKPTGVFSLVLPRLSPCSLLPELLSPQRFLCGTKFFKAQHLSPESHT